MTLDVLTVTILFDDKDGTTVVLMNMDTVLFISPVGLIGCIPLPVFGLGDCRMSTGTVIPTINPITRVTARPSIILNMMVLLEHRHLPGGRMF